LGLAPAPSIGRFRAIVQVQTGPVQVIVAVLHRSSIALQEPVVTQTHFSAPASPLQL
jgi:hypothetical protein